MSMSKSISILDKDYAHWVEDLSVRYRQSQIRASVKVNRELLRYYWELGRHRFREASGAQRGIVTRISDIIT